VGACLYRCKADRSFCMGRLTGLENAGASAQSADRVTIARMFHESHTFNFVTMELRKARSILIEKGRLIQPFVETLGIVGSVRRQKQEVHDVELCCVPKLVNVPKIDLFDTTPNYVVHPEFICTVNSLGKVIKGKPTGRMMQIDLPEGIKLDLFMPQRLDYWRMFAIRTGSSDYSRYTIAAAWLRMGWCGTDEGLRLQSECFNNGKDGKNDWACTLKNPTLPPVWESEEAFFNWINVPYLPPYLRKI